jgi:hypothetical protein
VLPDHLESSVAVGGRGYDVDPVLAEHARDGLEDGGVIVREDAADGDTSGSIDPI